MAEPVPLAVFPTLKTNRLILRELTQEDAADVFIFRGDPEEQKYNSDPLKSMDEVGPFIEEIRQGFANRQAIQWAVVEADTKTVIGLMGINSWNTYHAYADLGYDLRRDRWGKGLAAEALTAIIRFGFDGMSIQRVEASTLVENVRSVRLLERLGFVREGIRRKRILGDDGVRQDSALFGLLRHEFLPVP